MYQILRKHPMPDRWPRTESMKYPLDKLKVGDCMVVNLQDEGFGPDQDAVAIIYTRARNWALFEKVDQKFSVRKLNEEQVGIWRTK